ncbi:ester cyclase [Chitinophaga caseinilytica]|uniref:Ester cyclase n=1 Tax=Chitinophaga caseinilytica TaxID=2267521 RepID=A0ABZ2Z9G3_9BACT
MMTTILSAASLALSVSLSPESAPAQHFLSPAIEQTDTSTAQHNKEVVRQLFEQVINERHFADMPKYVANEYTGPSGLKGPAAFEASILGLIRSFPDIRWQLLEFIAEGDKVMVKWQWKGTHAGDFQHISATGLHITHNAIAIFTLKHEKVIDGFLFNDRLGFLQQLRQLPADESQIRAKNQPGEVRFVDQFTVPAAAKKAFLERVRINRDFIKTLPGFLEDELLGHTAENGDFICITTARWKNAEALQAAKTAVQQAYRKEGFDPAAFMQKLKIRMERGVFEPIANTEE